MSQRMIITEEELYELLSYLVSSAHMCVIEPKLYGPQRLIEAASRFIGFALESGQLEGEQFLREFKEDIDEDKFLLATDEEGFFQFLEDTTRRIAKEMKRRVATSEGNL